MGTSSYIVEAYQPQPKLTVDRENGLIRGVKVLGLNSKNKRRYSKKAILEAIERYRNLNVYANHPINPSTGQPDARRARSVEEMLGVLESPEMRDDGLYADLRYLKSHPMTERLLEAAERLPNAFGLSHAARVETVVGSDGIAEVVSIPEVRSVDLVVEPGTVRGLHESRSYGMTTLRKYFEALLPHIHTSKKKHLQSVYEADEMMSDMPMPDSVGEPDSGDPDEAMWTGFSAAIDAVLQKYKSGDMDSKAVAKKIADLLKTHEKLAAGGASEESPEPSEPDDKAAESQSWKQAMLICESVGVSPTSVLLEAMSAVPEATARKLAQQQLAAFEATAPKSSAPRSSSKSEQLPADPKEFARKIKKS